MTGYRLDQIFIGTPALLPDGSPSAIYKQPVAGPIAVTADGLAGDDQADPDNHGGPERALHHYPIGHYAFWNARLAPPEPLAPGVLGENLSIDGLTEADVHVGDVFTLGTARLQLSQPRWPCWKPGARLSIKPMARELITQGRAGWFYRVLAAGEIAPGDTLARSETADHGITLARLWQLKNTTEPDAAMREEIAFMIDYAALAPDWRDRLRKRASS